MNAGYTADTPLESLPEATRLCILEKRAVEEEKKGTDTLNFFKSRLTSGVDRRVTTTFLEDDEVWCRSMSHIKCGGRFLAGTSASLNEDQRDHL